MSRRYSDLAWHFAAEMAVFAANPDFSHSFAAQKDIFAAILAFHHVWQVSDAGYDVVSEASAARRPGFLT